MSNVVTLGGKTVEPAQVNQALVNALEALLERAKTGEVQSLIGTGFQADGLRVAVWGDSHANVYEMLGALAWLQAEYIHKKT